MASARELLAAQDEGAVIRVSDPDSEYAGEPVVYDPQGFRDQEPWRAVNRSHRFTSAQCRAEGLNGGPWRLARLLRF